MPVGTLGADAAVLYRPSVPTQSRERSYFHGSWIAPRVRRRFRVFSRVRFNRPARPSRLSPRSIPPGGWKAQMEHQTVGWPRAHGSLYSTDDAGGTI